MIPRGVAKRYATALFNAALAAKIAEDVQEETQGFRRILAKQQNLRTFLLSPQVLTKEKKDVIEAILKGNASELFVRFLLLLIDKKRFSYVEEIADGYNYLYERRQGIIEVKAITAVPLDTNLEDKLTAKLKADTGKSIRLVREVDPAIMGGMVLVLEDRIIDGSIRHQIQQMKRELDEIRV